MPLRCVCLGSLFIVAIVAAVAPVAPAGAQTATATLSANVGGLAKLSFSTTSLAFPDSNPDLFPEIPALPGPVTITAKSRASADAVVTLTVQADDDLRSGLATIPAEALTWTGSGPGFTNGTVSRTAPRLVASWTGSGVRIGTQAFLFRNAWTHATGTYTVALLYTLTSP